VVKKILQEKIHRFA